MPVVEFTLVRSPTFTDLETMEKEYILELEEAVGKAIGADHVVAWGPIIRRADTVKLTKTNP